MILTFKFRLRDRHSAELSRQARAVNYVWNYCNETQQKAVQSGRKWLTGYDLQKLTAGSSTELNLHAHTIQRVCHQYDYSRKLHKKAWLRWRGRKSLGWVPFNQGHVTFDGATFRFRGVHYQPMHLRDIPDGAIIHAGSFNADSRGYWYINVPIELPAETFERSGETAVGADLGLKSLAVLSTGETMATPQHYRQAQER